MLSKVLGRAGLLLVVIGVVVGLGFYHHARGARFVVRLAPASAPPAPSDCSGVCAKTWSKHSWIRGTVTNVGHRGGYLVCDVQAFDPQGRKVYGGSLPTWSWPAGPFVEVGETHTWMAYLGSGRSLGPLGRLVGTCWGVDYHGRIPI